VDYVSLNDMFYYSRSYINFIAIAKESHKSVGLSILFVGTSGTCAKAR
jgi:hypothetical protein